MQCRRLQRRRPGRVSFDDSKSALCGRWPGLAHHRLSRRAPSRCRRRPGRHRSCPAGRLPSPCPPFASGANRTPVTRSARDCATLARERTGPSRRCGCYRSKRRVNRGFTPCCGEKCGAGKWRQLTFRASPLQQALDQRLDLGVIEFPAADCAIADAPLPVEQVGGRQTFNLI